MNTVISVQEICGALLTVAALLLLLGLGKQRKQRRKEFPMSVMFWCSHTSEQFVVPVRNLGQAQNFINKVNLHSVSAPVIINEEGTTHLLNTRGVWVEAK